MEHYTLPHQHSLWHNLWITYLTLRISETTANIFKQLSEPTRIHIFWILCHCEECVIN